MSTPENLEAPPVARKRKRELLDELEWEATVIDRQEVKEEEQAHTGWLRQCEERKKAFHVKKQKVLEKADELRNDGLKEEEPCLPDSDVEIIEKNPFADSQKETVVSRVDSGRAIREARKDNPIPSVESSPAAKTLAPAPASDSSAAAPPAVVAATTSQAIPSSGQPSFTPIRPPMSYLLKLKLKRLKSAALPPSGEDHTSDSKRRNLSSPQSSQSLPSSQSLQSSQTSLSSQSSQSSQSAQLSQSTGVTTEVTQVEASKDVATSGPSSKPAQPMLAPSRNTKMLSLTPKNTPAAPDEAPQPVSQPSPETAPETAPMIAPMTLEEAPQTAPETAAAPTKRRPGRPNGLKNKPKPAQQSAVADGAGFIPRNQKEAQELLEREAGVQNRSSSYLEVEAPAPGPAQPLPAQAVTGNRRLRRAPLQKASKQASATTGGQVLLPESTTSGTGCIASTVVPESAPVRGQAASGWITVNGPQTAPAIASNYAVEVPGTLEISLAASSQVQQRLEKGEGKKVEKQPPKTMQVVIRAGSEVCFDENGDVVSGSQLVAEKEADLRAQQEEAANRAQDKAKKEDELRAQHEAEEEAKDQAARRSQWDAEEEAKQDAARRAQQGTKAKGVRRLDEEAARRRKKHSRAGRDASVMRHGTPLRNSGTTREIERMKKMSIVVATDDGKRARKPQATKEMLTASGSAAQAQQENKKEKADAPVSKNPVAEDRQPSVFAQKIDVLQERQGSPDDLDEEELLDAMDKMRDVDEAGQEDDRDDTDVVPATQTPPEQSSKTSLVEPEQQVPLAPAQDRRPVPMADLPTPPASQELLEPSIEADDQEEDAITPLRQAASSTIARLATPAGTITALPATVSPPLSGGSSAVMFGVISRLTINLPEEMQKKVVEYVLSMEKTISELPTPPAIYTGHITTPFFQTRSRPSAMWHEVITTLAMDLSEEQQKAVVEYVLVLKKNKK